MSDPAIPAATLVLVREPAGLPPEILVVERAQGMAFAGGALVFPGGRIDEGDQRLADQLNLANGAAAVAAIRETLEETAIPAGLDPLPSDAQARDMQRELLGGRGFGEILDASQIRIDSSALIAFARWLPKIHVSRRFDTMFLLARAPEGDLEPNPIEGECSGAYWLTPLEVLAREARGEARLIFPTRRTLERLALHSSFAAMRADAAAHPVEPITPWIEEHDGEKFITIADHLGFPVTRERLDGLWRG